MSDLGHATILWIAERSSSQVVLARSMEDGIPEPVTPAPSLFKVSYVSVAEAQEEQWQSSWNSLSDRYAPLAVKLASPDGPPAQLLLLYGHKGEEQVTYRVGSRSHHGQHGTVYRAVAPSQGWGWESELGRGRFGYFLVGAPQGTNLWRITRMEVDHLGRSQFTVLPVTMPHGLPMPKFDTIEAPLRDELVQHWIELERAYVEHRSYALVTAAKNVGEVLLYWKLREKNGRKRHDIGNLLQTLKSLLDDKTTRDAAPFSQLEYHILSKVRLLHERTHPERATRERLTPELALSTAQDIVAVLRSLRLAD